MTGRWVKNREGEYVPEALGAKAITKIPKILPKGKRVHKLGREIEVEWRWVGKPPLPPSAPVWIYKVMPTVLMSDVFRGIDAKEVIDKALASPPPKVKPLLSEIRTTAPIRRFVARQIIEI